MRTGRAKRATSLLLVLIVTATASIAGSAIYTLLRHRSRQLIHRKSATAAHYLAKAGVQHALWKIRSIFRRKLVSPVFPAPGEEQSIDTELLELLDPDQARHWYRSYELSDPMIRELGHVRISMRLLDVRSTPYGSQIPRYDKIPPALEPYRESRQTSRALSPLGGWRGKLYITSKASCGSFSCTLHVVKKMEVMDVTPPANEYTLFIEGEKKEVLKEGRFILSNLDPPAPVKKKIEELEKRFRKYLGSEEDKKSPTSLLVRNAAAGDSPKELFLAAHRIASAVSDMDVKCTLDSLVLSLNPRNWGKVRCNGTMIVYLPFFELDDIIDYLGGYAGAYGGSSEVGYIGCDNRLHDPYMSIYTIYEGRIYKKFRRIRTMGRSRKPVVFDVPPQRYTVNTKTSYVLRHPSKRTPPRLERMRTSAARYFPMYSRKELVLRGTPADPIRLDKAIYSEKPILISGWYTGKGVMVTPRRITICGDIRKATSDSLLSLVSLKREIVLDPSRKEYRVEAALCARKGVAGRKEQKLSVYGNLCVFELARKRMPGSFECKYDATLKNHGAGNLACILSRRSCAVVWK